MVRRGSQSPIETMVRVYKSPTAYARDAKTLAKKGWSVATVTHRQPRAGIGRIVTLGLLTLLRPPRPELVVTYQRTRPGANAAGAALPSAAAPFALPAPPVETKRGSSPLRTLVLIGIVLLLLAMMVL